MKAPRNYYTTLLALFAASILVHSTSAQTINFFDDFESPTLDSFWSTTTLNGGTLSLSTAQAFSGTHSLQSTTLNNGLNHENQLFHDFGVPVYGTVSLRIFDSVANLTSGNYLEFYTTTGVGDYQTELSTKDFDLGPSNGGHYYYNSTLTGPVNTPIDRTQAWHLFSLTVEQAAVSMSIDGTEVYSGPGAAPFIQVVFDQHAPGFRPGVTSYVDTAQISVHVAPEPSSCAFIVMGALFTGSLRRRHRNASSQQQVA